MTTFVDKREVDVEALQQDLGQLRMALDAAARESERRGKVLLAMRGLIVEFINKHNVPTTAHDLLMSETGTVNKDGSYTTTERKLHGPLEGNNLHTSLHWLQSIFTWAEAQLTVTTRKK